MVSPRPRRLATFALLALLAGSVGAQQIKMPTLSPEGSPWDNILKRMGKAWEEGTDGRVSLVLYPGGVAGDEPDIVRKIRIGQYQATALSVAGLADIDKAFTVFEIPLFYRSFEEMRHVLDVLSPILTQRLEENGFKLLGWGYVGWVYFFTTEPVATLADMQALKIFTWAGDDAMVQWWRRNGFKPVSLAATDIITGLETGMIGAVSMPPLYAMQMQYYKKASYMADVPLAPMMGAILISKRSFDRMSPADQKVVLAAGKKAEGEVLEQIPKLDAAAVTMMSNNGLTVLKISDSEHAREWMKAAEVFADNMRGTIVPTDVFDPAAAARKAFREQSASGEGP